MSKEEIARKADSITKARIIESDAAARKDLERRIKIEVKVKADSILNAKLHPKVKDTVRKSSLFPNRLM